MSSTIKTENLKLSQFQNADVPSWRTDYNSDMNKIDSAYANSISGQVEENDIQNGDYLGFYDVSAGKNKKTLWSNILEKLGGVFSKNSQILSTVEECEASTENNNIAGASAIAELNSSLEVENIKTEGTEPNHFIIGRIGKMVIVNISVYSVLLTKYPEGILATGLPKPKNGDTWFPALTTSANYRVVISNSGVLKIMTNAGSNITEDVPYLTTSFVYVTND